MKIAFLTTGVFPVCRDTIKATEYWTFELAEEMTRRGHEVIVFGAADSEGNFKVIAPTHPIPYKSLERSYNYYPYLTKFILESAEYCVKNHIDLVHDQTTVPYVILLSSQFGCPVISTLHTVKNNVDLKDFYKYNPYTYNIAPSHFAKEASEISINKVIHHGLNPERFPFSETGGESFISIGRFVESKGQIDALMAAEIADLELKIGGYSIETPNSKSYYTNLQNLVKNSKFSSLIGKVPKHDVGKLFSQSKALMMPVKDDEAFGLVMIEAMLCGTPVIAYDRGPVKEIVKDGVSGIIVPKDNIEALAKAMLEVGKISRKKCREYAEEHFSFKRMADDYEATYQAVTRNGQEKN